MKTLDFGVDLQVLPPGILPVRGSTELLVSRVMEGKVTDWARARRAAQMIRSRDYTTKERKFGVRFHEMGVEPKIGVPQNGW